MRRVEGLDTLRAIAITWVFMYHHMVFVSHAPTFGWLSEIGWTGVDLFFVLSGYLIGNQIFAGIAGGRRLSLKAFYIRRFLRTLPVYYVVLALYFVLPAFMGAGPLPPLWKFLTFTQNYQLAAGTGFSHAWSLCVEEQFYLLLPALSLLLIHLRRPLPWAWILVGSLVAAAILTRCLLWYSYGLESQGGYYPHIYYSSFCRADEFLPGVAVAMLKNFHPALWQRVMGWGNYLLCLGMAGVSGVYWLLLGSYQIEGYGYGFFATGFGYSLMAIAFGVLVLAALSPKSLLHQVRVPGAAPLALWSYSIYLSHKAVAAICARILAGQGIPADSLAALLAIVPACLLVGWALYRLVETPFMNLRHKVSPSSFRRVTPQE